MAETDLVFYKVRLAGTRVRVTRHPVVASEKGRVYLTTKRKGAREGVDYLSWRYGRYYGDYEIHGFYPSEREAVEAWADAFVRGVVNVNACAEEAEKQLAEAERAKLVKSLVLKRVGVTVDPALRRTDVDAMRAAAAALAARVLESQEKVDA